MIRADGVLLDAVEAEFLAGALDHLARMMAEQRDIRGNPAPIAPSPRLAAMTARLRKTVASLAFRESDPDQPQPALTASKPPHRGRGGRASVVAIMDARPHGIGTAAAARILGVTPNGARDLARRGRVAARYTGTRWVFDAAAVVALAERRAADRAHRAEQAG